MGTAVDWYSIGKSIEWYRAVGYRYLEVPWIVSEGPYRATKPDDAANFYTLGGFLVASGEQSFMQMLDMGMKVGKAVCCTPCFRAEPETSDATRTYFMKVELIHVSGGKQQLTDVIGDAYNYFNYGRHIPADVMDMKDGTFDIVGRKSGVELGSYGIRKWNNFSWVYGTGLAEPRANYVQNLEYSGVV